MVKSPSLGVPSGRPVGSAGQKNMKKHEETARGPALAALADALVMMSFLLGKNVGKQPDLVIQSDLFGMVK